jgi:catechol 2,3-dioxygenase
MSVKEQTSIGVGLAYRIPAEAHIGRVRLAVSDLERSIEFYRDVIGLSVLEASGLEAKLGPHGEDRVLLELAEQPGVRPIAPHSRLGLYHTAFLLPSRTDLSRFVRHLWESGVPFGSGDHLVSEALYLVDPDGLEVEVYADRPRELWPYVGQRLRMGTEAVRLDELMALSRGGWQGAPAGTRIGHVHFYVGDLRLAEAFYVAGLGFDIVARMPSARFVSAGGYHHHVGLNTWAAGSPVAGDEDARLLRWELVLPTAEDVNAVKKSLVEAGFAETVDAGGQSAFVDDVGIAGRLVVVG